MKALPVQKNREQAEGIRDAILRYIECVIHEDRAMISNARGESILPCFQEMLQWPAAPRRRAIELVLPYLALHNAEISADTLIGILPHIHSENIEALAPVIGHIVGSLRSGATGDRHAGIVLKKLIRTKLVGAWDRDLHESELASAQILSNAITKTWEHFQPSVSELVDILHHAANATPTVRQTVADRTIAMFPNLESTPLGVNAALLRLSPRLPAETIDGLYQQLIDRAHDATPSIQVTMSEIVRTYRAEFHRTMKLGGDTPVKLNSVELARLAVAAGAPGIKRFLEDVAECGRWDESERHSFLNNPASNKAFLEVLDAVGAFGPSERQQILENLNGVVPFFPMSIKSRIAALAVA